MNRLDRNGGDDALESMNDAMFDSGNIFEMSADIDLSRHADETEAVVNQLVADVKAIFRTYLAKDKGVQAGISYLSSCHFKKMIHHAEHHPKFVKLKILLAKNQIIDLNFKKLVPIADAMLELHNLTKHEGGKPCFLNLMFAIEKRMDKVQPKVLMHYNIYHNHISKRVRETSTASIISYLLKSILIVPVWEVIFHDFVRMSLHFHMLTPLLYAILNIYQLKLLSVKALNIQQVYDKMDSMLQDGAKNRKNGIE